MSMGKWNEDAQVDEMDLVRNALITAKTDKSVEIAERLGLTPVGIGQKVKMGTKGAKVTKARKKGPKYPYAAIDAEGRKIRFRVVDWAEGTNRVEVRQGRKTDNPRIGVDKRLNLSSETSVEDNPEWLITTLTDRIDESGNSDIWGIVNDWLIPTRRQNRDNLDKKMEGSIYRAMSYTSDKPGHSCDDNAIRDDSVKRGLRDEATDFLLNAGYGMWGNPLPIDV